MKSTDDLSLSLGKMIGCKEGSLSSKRADIMKRGNSWLYVFLFLRILVISVEEYSSCVPVCVIAASVFHWYLYYFSHWDFFGELIYVDFFSAYSTQSS